MPSRCNAVEGNTTFYAVPPPATVASWARQVPADFNLVCKLPRTITHEARLSGEATTTALDGFLEAIAPLGGRVGTVVAQLPGSFGPSDLGALAGFLRRLPRQSPHRFTVEVRHPSFFDGSAAARSLEQLLGRSSVEWIGFDTTTMFAAPPTTAAGARRVGEQASPAPPHRCPDRPPDRPLPRTG